MRSLTLHFDQVTEGMFPRSCFHEGYPNVLATMSRISIVYRNRGNADPMQASCLLKDPGLRGMAERLYMRMFHNGYHDGLRNTESRSNKVPRDEEEIVS